MKGMGLPTSTAILAATMFQVGGIAGALGQRPLGHALRHRESRVRHAGDGRLLAGSVGREHDVYDDTLDRLYLRRGHRHFGGTVGHQRLAGRDLSARIRNTGAGWSLGIGRLGNIGGPLLGGQLLALGWAPKEASAGDFHPRLPARGTAAGAGEGARQFSLASNASLRELSAAECRTRLTLMSGGKSALRWSDRISSCPHR